MHGPTSSHQRMEYSSADKETFFEDLYELDEPDHSICDVDNLLSTLKACRPSKSRLHANRRRLIHTSRRTQSLRKTVSDPVAASPLPKAPLTHNGTESLFRTTFSIVSKAPTVDTPRLSFDTNVEIPIAIDHPKMPSSTIRKRKRGRSPVVLPEAQQIFKGLKFCTLPYDLSG